MSMPIEDDDWTSPENPLDRALRNHRFQPIVMGERTNDIGLVADQPTVCSCGQTPDNKPPTDDYDWWITHLKANI